MESRLHQQLLELHHGLLVDEEAAELRARLPHDPVLAKAWSQVQQEVGLITQAARLEAPPLGLKLDESQAIKPISTAVRHPEAQKTRARLPGKQTSWGWAIGLAAGVMLILSLGGFQFHRTRLARLDRELPRVVIAGPSRLTPGVANRFSVTASTVSGQPLAMNMLYSLYDVDRQQSVQLHRQETDRQGRMTIEFSARDELPVHLELRLATAQAGLQSPLASLSLPVAKSEYLTKLATDRPSYHPGDYVYFRSVTLRQTDLKPISASPIQFQVLDAAGNAVPACELTGLPDRGVGNGSFGLPADATLGEYRLLAASVEDRFQVAEQRFLVTPPSSEQLGAEIAFAQPDYAPGEDVNSSLQFWSDNGSPAAGADVTLFAKIADREVWRRELQLDQEGRANAHFGLPLELNGDATLTAVANVGNEQAVAKAEIPVISDVADVRFYPEGGDLVAGVENRVYFSVRDQLSRPLEVSGEIVDDQQHVLSEATTKIAGRGVFRLSPQAGRTYRLRLPGADDPNSWPTLPLVRSDQAIALSVPQAVIAAGEPLRAVIHDRRGATPLVVATYCRGRQVGQTALVTVAGQNRIQTDPGAEADGILRVTVLDCAESTPKPVAERLVYRQSVRRLTVDVQGLKDGIYLPEELAQIQAQVSDESERPAAGVVLGVSVVDADLDAPSGQLRTSVEAYFRLASQVERPAELEHAELRLGDTKSSAEALDLLLGTQGWRRFVAAPTEQLAQQQPMAPQGEIDATEATSLLLWDNLADVQPRYEQRAEHLRSEQAQLLAMLMICGGVGLAVALVLAILWRLVASLEWALPSLAAAAGCVVMGVLLVRSTDRGTPPAASVAFANSSAPVEIAAAPRADRAATAARKEASDSDDANANLEGLAIGKGDGPGDTVVEKTSAPILLEEKLGEFDEQPPPSARLGDEPPAADAPQEAPLEPTTPAPAPAESPTRDLAEERMQQRPASRAVRAGTESAAGVRELSRQVQLTPVLRQRIAGLDTRWQLQLGGDKDASQTVYRNQARVPRGDFNQSFVVDAAAPDDAKAAKGGRTEDESVLRRGNVAAPAQVAAVAQVDTFLVRQYAFEPPLSAAPGQASSPASVYWHPFLVTDEEGKATFAFPLGSDEAEYMLRIDAHDTNGRVAAAEKALQVGYPVLLAQTLPSGLTAGDRYDASVRLENSTSYKQSVEMQTLGELPALQPAAPAVTVELLPKEQKQFYLSIQAEQPLGRDVVVGLEGNTAAPNDVMFKERVEQRLSVTPDGYPVTETQSGWLLGSKEVAVRMPEQPVPGSLSVRFFAYPGLPADLEHARQAIAALPQENLNTKFALAQIDRRLGYVSAVSTDFGAVVLSREQAAGARGTFAPGASNDFFNYWSFGTTGDNYQIEALGRGGIASGSPYGPQVQQRYSESSGQRGYNRADASSGSQSRARYGGASRAGGLGGGYGGGSDDSGFGYAGLPQTPNDVTLAWSIANGYTVPDASDGLVRLKKAEEYSREREEPVTTGVVANGLLQLGEQTTGQELLGRLVTWQQADGSVPNPTSEVGKSVATTSTSTVANTSVAALAWFKSKAYHESAKKAVEWLGTQRASGGFGSADDTYLALRALKAHAEQGYRGVAEGEVSLALGDEVIANQTLEPARPELVTFENLESRLAPGENRLSVSATTPSPLAYGIEVRYHKSEPVNDPSLLLGLSTSLATDSLALDQQTKLSVEVTNRSALEQQFVTAEIGLPAGLEPVIEQLDSLRTQALIDFYETRSRTIIPYWRKLAPQEIRRVELDVKATAPGKFTGPASNVYLLDAPNARNWSAPLKVEVTQPAK